MSLTSRRPRPIPRQGKLRDARLFVIATEDRYGPKQYFSFFPHPRIHVEVLGTGEDGRSSPRAVVDRLITFADEYQIAGEDQLWVLLDTDRWILGQSKSGLVHAIEAARQRGYRIAMSNPCFDLWLLLHHESVSPGTPFDSCKAVGLRIRNLMGEFNKTNLKAVHYPIAKVLVAVDRAKVLESNPNLVGASANYWPEVSGTRIFILIEELKAAGMFPSQ